MRKHPCKKIYKILIIILIVGLVIKGFSNGDVNNQGNPLKTVKTMGVRLATLTISDVCTPAFRYVSQDKECNIVEKIIYGYFPIYLYIKEEIYLNKGDNDEEFFREEVAGNEENYENVLNSNENNNNDTETKASITVTGEVQEISSQVDISDITSMAAMENENARVKGEEDNIDDSQYTQGMSAEDKEMATGNEGIIENGENDNDPSDMSEAANINSDIEENQGGIYEEENVEIAPTNGKVYTIEQLSDIDFLKNTIYTVDSSTSFLPERFNIEKLMNTDLSIEKDPNVPQILIYHTHSQESFADSLPGDSSTSIVAVGSYLATLLANNYGYNVIHNTSSYDMIGGNLDRNYAFTLAEADVRKILNNNPSIQVVIDLHRDGVNENTHFISKVNGKDVAKIMFFNGLSYNNKVGDIAYLNNPYIEENLSFSLQMQLKALEKYPDYVRKIYLKGYRYNLHLMPRATLIEVGGQTNTFEEAKNAMEPLAEILAGVLGGK